jgi:hypothetical protein
MGNGVSLLGGLMINFEDAIAKQRMNFMSGAALRKTKEARFKSNLTHHLSELKGKFWLLLFFLSIMITSLDSNIYERNWVYAKSGGLLCSSIFISVQKFSMMFLSCLCQKIFSP